MNEFGLTKEDIDVIKIVLKEHDIQQAVIFGSRALGTYRHSSDVDIALLDSNINHETILDISDILNNEVALPYQFDIINYTSINNKALKKHIDRVGKSI